MKGGDRIYGERCNHELALKRAQRFWPRDPFVIREGYRSCTPLRGGDPYLIRCWLASIDGKRWFYITACVVGRKRAPGATMTSYSYTEDPIFNPNAEAEA